MAQNFADEIERQNKFINNQLDYSSKDKNTRLPLMGGKWWEPSHNRVSRRC